ncbi:hypothetical protein UP10_15585 [Bradyrhizobium sp. LTSPM299]|jgi:hypothetical protein|uniref:hypothetical protein n=1 Tax=Bradyrhizobium sp. LTSPM299 TaxID=1619233 RepID=UPI0005CA412C|nr:hypothetical protein [Bradyrhizobium sp. LTSPM299]KJC60084.1 hypothetical protein UP10_15585 [Bradyrhizobium sp. LTSPM299]
MAIVLGPANIVACRAIQLADLIAYYSRRDGIALLKSKEPGVEQEIDPIIRILTEKLVHRGFVATGFHDRPGIDA